MSNKSNVSKENNKTIVSSGILKNVQSEENKQLIKKMYGTDEVLE